MGSILSKWKVILSCLLAAAALYWAAVYSSIPFIEKWRTIYIETAMSTMNHQWLATAFLPQSVIDEVMTEVQRQMEDNVVDSSKILEIARNQPEIDLEQERLDAEEAARSLFAQTYYEINMDTMPEDMDYTQDIQISNAVDQGIKTRVGDSVWAIDTVNRLLIIEVTGDGYIGKLAIVKDSSRVKLAVNKRKGMGMSVTELCEAYDAVLGINGSAFEDQGGVGSGASAVGLMISEGSFAHSAYSAYSYQIAGFDYEDRFRVGKNLDTSQLRDAMQFYPITVLDGEKHTTGSFGLGIQPRSSIGQTVDGSTLMLIIDGRQVGYSLGTTVSECADILLRYHCQNAMNLDGGSSASMSYMGEMITRTSSPRTAGRLLPSAWVAVP